MRYVVVTYGTEGDARPLAALCRALLDAGHDARLLADRETLGVAQSLAVPAAPLAGDMKRSLHAGRSRVVAKAGGFRSMANAFAEIAGTNSEAWMRDIVANARGCDAIIASGLAAFVGLSAAEYLDVKAIGAGFIPITPTAAFPSPFLPPISVPRFLNRASHRLVNAMLWRAFRKATNAARANVCNLPPAREVWDRHPMLYGISPTLVPRPDDWPSNARICGQWIPPSPGWSPPQALRDFLSAGEAPLYIGFGSMAGFAQQRLVEEVAIAVAGRRALFYPGWSEVDTSALPANFLVVDSTPHSWLFPRTALVVHHGGSGTTHSATRAGVPSVVVPFAGDQYFWADRLERLGAAPRAVSATKLRAADLARSIEAASTYPIRSRARALGESMRAENAVGDAMAAIDRIMDSKGVR